MAAESIQVITLIILLLLSATGLTLLVLVIQFWMVRRHSKAAAIELVDSLLPQTQCGYCSYAGCKPYAEAIVAGEAINKCPPGGQATVDRLAALLDEPRQFLDPAHGSYRPATIARIREDECIGCTKCIQACPVDAILGAASLMHTVIEEECTGCDLCLDPCPVDCIDMEPVRATAMQSLAGVYR